MTGAVKKSGSIRIKKAKNNRILIRKRWRQEGKCQTGCFPSSYYKEAIRTRKGTAGKGKMMYSTILTASMAREEWLQLRKTGIGGSDAGAVCGLSSPGIFPKQLHPGVLR